MIYETHVDNSQSRDIHGMHSSPALLNKIARKKVGTKEQQMKNLPGRKLFIRVPKKSKIKKKEIIGIIRASRLHRCTPSKYLQQVQEVKQM